MPGKERTLNLSQLATAEQREVRRSARALGSLWTTADTVVESYGLIADAIESVVFSPQPQDANEARHRVARAVTANYFLRMAARASQQDFLNIARRHLPEALGNRRRSFDLIAFAWLIWKDQEPDRLAERWLLSPLTGPDEAPLVEEPPDDGSAPEASPELEEYRERFKNSRIKGALKELDPFLRIAYDKLSHRIHPSLHGTVMGRTHRADQRGLDRVGPFDYENFNRHGLISEWKTEQLLQAFHCHFRGIEGFVHKAFGYPGWSDALRASEPVLESLRRRILDDQHASDGRLRALDECRETFFLNREWDQLLARVSGIVDALPRGKSITVGYRRLRDILGNELLSRNRFRVLSHLVRNEVPENLSEYAALGRVLASIRKEYTPRTLICLRERLLSDREEEALGAIAELNVYGGLRSHKVAAQLLRATGEGRAADIIVPGATPIEIEVSYLGGGQPWRLSELLRIHLEQRLRETVIKHTLFVTVSCKGFAGDLLRHVEDACVEFEKRVKAGDLGEAEVAPGLTFSPTRSTVCNVIVQHALIRSSDPLGKEGMLTRLPDKLQEEVGQIREQGIVVICTSELSCELWRAGAAENGCALLAELIQRIHWIGSRATKIGAFAVLDETGATLPVPSDDRDAPKGATLTNAVKGLTLQRLLWVPNPHVTVSIPPDSERWFALPF
jgi:hypothetical protein